MRWNGTERVKKKEKRESERSNTPADKYMLQLAIHRECFLK